MPRRRKEEGKWHRAIRGRETEGGGKVEQIFAEVCDKTQGRGSLTIVQVQKSFKGGVKEVEE